MMTEIRITKLKLAIGATFVFVAGILLGLALRR